MDNERVVLRAHFDDWKREAGKPRETDPWVYYCLEQFLKPYSLDPEEIEFGITDRGNNGGADGIYFFVNQGQLVDADTELDPKSVSKIRLILFQVKNSGGVKPTEIESGLRSLTISLISAKTRTSSDRDTMTK